MIFSKITGATAAAEDTAAGSLGAVTVRAGHTTIQLNTIYFFTKSFFQIGVQ